jgi:serine/threonine protein kinase
MRREHLGELRSERARKANQRRARRGRHSGDAHLFSSRRGEPFLLLRGRTSSRAGQARGALGERHGRLPTPIVEIDQKKSPVSPGDVLAGKYRVERVLGVGGMGVVVAATHLQLEQLVALKFLLPAALAKPSAVGRFEREARAAVRLRSEHVARVSDVGTMEDGAPYIVMEYLEGRDLGARVDEDGPLSVVEAVDYLLQTCEAVAEAHALGIIHRDLKPQNLFLTSRVDGKPLVKVLDFGISKVTQGVEELSLTKTTDVVGSPNYMSPEQLRAARLADARSDIWALGAILYELLSGKVPFEAETLTQLCAMVISDPPRPLKELRADLPLDLIAIIERCLDKDPARRFQNVGELADALEPFAVGTFTTTGAGPRRTSFASPPLPPGKWRGWLSVGARRRRGQTRSLLAQKNEVAG